MIINLVLLPLFLELRHFLAIFISFNLIVIVGSKVQNKAAHLRSI